MMTKDWTSIAVRKDTHKNLEELKIVKSPGKIENFDDVIRRGMKMKKIDETAGDST
jgi:hypothetical protein